MDLPEFDENLYNPPRLPNWMEQTDLRIQYLQRLIGRTDFYILMFGLALAEVQWFTKVNPVTWIFTRLAP